VRKVGNEDTTPADKRIFSPHSVAGLCVTSGRYWYLFKRLTAVSARRVFRFEHKETHNFFKPLSKQRDLATRKVIKKVPRDAALFLSIFPCSRQSAPAVDGG